MMGTIWFIGVPD